MDEQRTKGGEVERADKEKWKEREDEQEETGVEWSEVEEVVRENGEEE